MKNHKFPQNLRKNQKKIRKILGNFGVKITQTGVRYKLSTFCPHYPQFIHNNAKVINIVFNIFHIVLVSLKMKNKKLLFLDI